MNNETDSSQGLLRPANRVYRFQDNIVRQLLEWANKPGVMQFSAGSPSPELFKSEWIISATQTVFSKYKNPLGYGTTPGCMEIRTSISKMYTSKGTMVDPSEIVLSIGASQAIFAFSNVMLNEGDFVVVPKPTFIGALGAFRNFTNNIIGISHEDETGISIAELEKSMEHRPKFFYIVPDFDNPTGITTSQEKRIEIARIAEKFNVFILEDNPYSELEYEKVERQSIFELNPEKVILLGSFSKMPGLPGFRLGWAVIRNKEIRQRFVQSIQAINACPPRFNELLVVELIEMGVIDEVKKTAIPFYREKMNFSIICLEKYMPNGVTWTHPKGGLFLHITLPSGVDATALLEKTRDRVVFPPTKDFLGEYNQLRFNFSFEPKEKIEEGIKIMAEAIKEIKK